jgi:hypothetical protein
MPSPRSCSRCGQRIPAGAPFCAHCGARQLGGVHVDSFDKDPYIVLQVSRDAEDEVIDAAYRSLAKKYHPDRAGVGADEERMKEINWAYGTLKDRSKRRAWDSSNPEDGSTKAAEPRKEAAGSGRPSSGPESGRPAEPRTSPPHSPTDPPSAKRQGTKILVFLALGVLILGVCGICGILVLAPPSMSDQQAVGQVATSRSASTRPPPTRTPRLRPTSTPRLSSAFLGGSDCISWRAVNSAMKGRRACVFGVVSRVYSTEQYGQIIRFSSSVGDFLLRGEYYYFEGVEPGLCIATNGTVLQAGGYLYMNIDASDTELFKYSGC